MLRIALTLNRQLDAKNPSPSAIGSDFNRFNLEFWDVIKQRAPVQNRRRQDLLEELNTWRNAIAHQDFATRKLNPNALKLSTVQKYRNAICSLPDLMR